MPLAYIALGSNLGDRYATLSAAVHRLHAEPGLRVRESSEFYETAPVNCPPDSGAFLNAVVAIETAREPHDLLQLLLRTERQFGRVRGEPNSPRTLDLDLILYGDRVLNTPELTLPHPRMHERDFVLAPLAEAANSIGDPAVHPILKKTAQELYEPFLATYADPSVPRPRLYFERRQRPQTLTGLRALVTGSTSGIGATIANEFQFHGAEVVRHGRRAKLAPDERFVSADLRDPAQVDRLACEAWDTFGGLDVLVCNAGADTLTGDGAKLSFDEKLEALLAVDLKATMRLSRDIGTRMKQRGRGSVLTVGWDQAETGMEGDSGQLFAAVKGAVTCFTRSLALSLAPEVRANCLAPGWVRTAWGETASDVWQERVRDETPLGVWGLADDVAAAAVWLASPAARFITGQTIRVNGGAVRA
ncbi:MAG: 2-amino-4-hydroxy-6-hydroxymethyldihydropteridine diphosphokinase [Planctomycetes bacterium]|nr:2-amino-4-hydroxy-6-hydroxymethyldihydropteridine diphosphokinase [Planctomycetota bacterium]